MLPPLVAVAVKVTVVPAQTWFADATIDTLAVINGYMTMMMELEVAGFPVAHVAPDVRVQVTISLFDGM